MAFSTGKKIKIAVGAGETVFALLDAPAKPRTCFVFAHGAGAGMTHRFMEAVATGLAARMIATLRYQFPYMEKGSKRPDAPALAHKTVRAAAAEAAQLLPKVPLIAGGKSFGGRMTSQAQAADPLPGVVGLVFFGFPLHPVGKPSVERATHLSDIAVPMLFLQGAEDKLAELNLLTPVIAKLGARATLKVFPHADHSFHVPVRSGRKDSEILDEALDAMAAWTKELI
ncbi:MAG: alpha/beta hydrolase family protein [Xanthobacteraceae bacterium]